MWFIYFIHFVTHRHAACSFVIQIGGPWGFGREAVGPVPNNGPTDHGSLCSGVSEDGWHPSQSWMENTPLVSH